MKPFPYLLLLFILSFSACYDNGGDETLLAPGESNSGETTLSRDHSNKEDQDRNVNLLNNLKKHKTDIASDIDPADYEIIIKDSLGDRFFLNKCAVSYDKGYKYKGHWLSKWDSGEIKMVTAVFDKTNNTVALNARFQEAKLLIYCLTLAPASSTKYTGYEAYIKFDDPYTNKVYDITIEVEKGEFGK